MTSINNEGIIIAIVVLGILIVVGWLVWKEQLPEPNGENGVPINNETKDDTFKDKFIFLEKKIHTNMGLIGGHINDYLCGEGYKGSYDRGPSYYFSKEDGIVQSWDPPMDLRNMTANITIIYGKYFDGWRHIDVGSGYYMLDYGHLRPIYSLPWQEPEGKGQEKSHELIIKNMTDNGTLSLIYKNKTIILDIDEEWKNVTENIYSKDTKCSDLEWNSIIENTEKGCSGWIIYGVGMVGFKKNDNETIILTLEPYGEEENYSWIIKFDKEDNNWTIEPYNKPTYGFVLKDSDAGFVICARCMYNKTQTITITNHGFLDKDKNKKY